MSKSVWDMAKISKKYNRKAKLHGAVKSIRDPIWLEQNHYRNAKGEKIPNGPVH